VIDTDYPPSDSAFAKAGEQVAFYVNATDDQPLTYTWYINDMISPIIVAILRWSFDEEWLYNVRCVVSDNDRETTQSWMLLVRGSATGDEELPPVGISLVGYPHPCRGIHNLLLSLPQSGQAEVRIFNCRGEMVKRFTVPGVVQEVNRIFWDTRDDSGRPVADGVYLLRLIQGGS
jgi:hypothetical protein